MTEKSETQKLIIFDADGTLRRCTVPGQPCPNRDGEWELIPGVREKIASLPERMRFAIVSNQGGVGLGMMSEEAAYKMLEALGVAAFWDTRHDFFWLFACTHAPKAGCSCRKPSPEMLYKAMGHARAKPSETLYVGDMASDKEAAQRAGVAFCWACIFFDWPEPCQGRAEEIRLRRERHEAELHGPQPGYTARAQ